MTLNTLLSLLLSALTAGSRHPEPAMARLDARMSALAAVREARRAHVRRLDGALRGAL